MDYIYIYIYYYDLKHTIIDILVVHNYVDNFFFVKANKSITNLLIMYLILWNIFLSDKDKDNGKNTYTLPWL